MFGYESKVIEAFVDFFKKKKVKTKEGQDLEKLLSLSISDLNYILCDISDEIQIQHIKKYTPPAIFLEPGTFDTTKEDFIFTLEFDTHRMYRSYSLEVDEKLDRFKYPKFKGDEEFKEAVFIISFYTNKDISNDLYIINNVVDRIKDFGEFELTNTSYGYTGTTPTYKLWTLEFKY